MRPLSLRFVVLTLIAAAAAIGGVRAAAGAQAPPPYVAARDPAVGTWRLVLAKSKYYPGPAPQSETRTYEPDGAFLKCTIQRVDGKGRIPAVEVLVATGRAFDKIVNPDETHELEQIIAEGEYYGMQTFDQSLFGLYKNGLIGLRDALATASHPHDLRIALQQAGLPVGS